MVRNFILSILAGGLLTSLSVTAEELNHYVVAATIIEDGVVLGAPTLTVIPGEKTSVQVSGDQGYELSLTLSPTASAPRFYLSWGKRLTFVTIISNLKSRLVRLKVKGKSLQINAQPEILGHKTWPI